MNQDYVDTVRLLLDIAPAIFKTPRFAMKGGTALNLFVQDMPRLSVGIDVVFTDYSRDREGALQAIGADSVSLKRQSLRWVTAPCCQQQRAERTSSYLSMAANRE